MGYLLKEALKTLCGINQWSYAVFWKFGCQDSKLLTWEECYYEPASCYGHSEISGNGIWEIPYQDHNSSSVSTDTLDLRSGVPEANKVHLLVNKMMVDNRFNIVGEGLVGRVAFTGNHQWILSENYYRETHPPEVLKEVCLQFSAGMQTVALVPVLPHGVAQFGSYLTIAENIRFVNDVVSLIHELGCVPGVLQFANHEANELAPTVGFPVCPGYSTTQELPLESNMINASSFFADSLNYVACSTQTSAFDSHIPFPVAREVQNAMQSTIAAFQASNSGLFHLKPSQANKSHLSFQDQFMNGLARAEVILPYSIPRMNHYSPSSLENLSFCSSSTSTTTAGVQAFAVQTSSGLILSCNKDAVRLLPGEANKLHQGISSNIKPVPGIDSPSGDDRAASETVTSIHTTSSGLKKINLAKMETSFADSGDYPRTNSFLADRSGANELHTSKRFAQRDLSLCNEEMEQSDVLSHEIPPISPTQHAGNLKVAELVPGVVGENRKMENEVQCHPVISTTDNACFESQSGDDLFDILGADFKDKWLSNGWKSCLRDESATIMHNSETNDSPSRNDLASSEIYYTTQRKSDNGNFSFTGTSHLLDAVVSKDNPFPKQSLDANISCTASLNKTSSSAAPEALRPHESFGVSDNTKGDLSGMPKHTAMGGLVCSPSLSAASLKEDSGIYSQGSSIYDPWIERGHNTIRSNSVTTGYSTKPHEPSKTSRKRLKPGENPRPRPKDRQMIQDRVKELREIVPNGAKCSIDALLERTIKHMLFLQSVTKHADKLKQTAESKIISKDDGLLMKDNLGGATWAYEVGSQSMMCPIIVEDLNQPHQMLVEMLCEERGLFLEIADIIRGLGLTILKGLMETRDDKIWARFTVEANRNVTRMEIFLSLVRLLEQNAKSGVPQSSSTNNVMVQEAHQSAFVPASGGSVNGSIS